MQRTPAVFVLTLLLMSIPVATTAGDGVVALQTADPSCADDSGDRYVDCGNGTVTDNDTGLVWLANADCLGGFVDWHNAMESVAGLSDLPGDDLNDCGLEDGSSPGDWRLPSKAEWEAMVSAVCRDEDPPAITDDSGEGCWINGGSSFTGVATWYWSSTTQFSSNPASAFGALLNGIDILFIGLKTFASAGVWPVRGGQ